MKRKLVPILALACGTLLIGCSTPDVETNGIKPVDRELGCPDPGVIKAPTTSRGKEGGLARQGSGEDVRYTPSVPVAQPAFVKADMLNNTTAMLVKTIIGQSGDSSQSHLINQYVNEIAKSADVFLKKSDIASQWNTGTVSPSQLGQALLDHPTVVGLMKRVLGYPKCAIVVRDENSSRADLVAFTTLSNRFRTEGIECIPSTESAFYVKNIGHVRTSELARRVLRETGAQYLFIGTLTKGAPVSVNKGFTSNVTLAAECIDGVNNTVVFSISETQAGSGFAKAVAEKSGTQKVVDKLLDEQNITQKINRSWFEKIVRLKAQVSQKLNSSF